MGPPVTLGLLGPTQTLRLFLSLWLLTLPSSAPSSPLAVEGWGDTAESAFLHFCQLFGAAAGRVGFIGVVEGVVVHLLKPFSKVRTGADQWPQSTSVSHPCRAPCLASHAWVHRASM